MLSRRDNSCLFPPKLLYCFSQKTDRKGAVITLETAFNEVYTKFKLHFYQEIFRRFQDREASLTTVETFCMESIMALGSPTVNEFASFMCISSPNAAFKVNSLIRKGYLRKVQSEMERVARRFTPEECGRLEAMLEIVSHELMPEVQIPDVKA